MESKHRSWRVRPGQCGPRHAAHPGLARPPIDPAHHALHAIERGAVQGLLAITTPRLDSDSDSRSSTICRGPVSHSFGQPAALYQSPSGWRFTTRIRFRIMKRPAGFSATAAANAARARSSERQIASVSSPYTRLSGLGGSVHQLNSRGHDAPRARDNSLRQRLAGFRPSAASLSLTSPDSIQPRRWDSIAPCGSL
jgi:hypothetical protein